VVEQARTKDIRLPTSASESHKRGRR
jgi:hypothetical protein